ncbi:hypothetical protein [Defluviimonas salinarum]|uniref:DUF3298 domain-containing protein n=1 Tax=Defluviimonas salinarum TaxID=2992147 RepID=A0ABT3JAP2_9RHOB|nr:hypothetical protein [Defluviimonas salinarum]MCW3784778.1 hypothetical protein [Defluviimonas salinarum]
MKPEIVADREIGSRAQDIIRKFVLGGSSVDHRLQFRAEGEAEVRTLAKIHVTEQAKMPDGTCAAYPWSGQAGMGFDPFVTLEDTEGGLAGLQHCARAVPLKHVYGLILRVEDDLWIVSAKDQAAGTLFEDFGAGEIASEDFDFVRVAEQSEACVEQIGRISEIDVAADGEFLFSDEAGAVLVSCPWWGPFVDETMSQGLYARQMEIVEAVSDMVRRLQAPRPEEAVPAPC